MLPWDSEKLLVTVALFHVDIVPSAALVVFTGPNLIEVSNANTTVISIQASSTIGESLNYTLDESSGQRQSLALHSSLLMIINFINLIAY